jgi:uncharacterized damage-inducible protein DinB
MDLGTRIEPPLESTEKDMLVAWLDFHRATLLMKVDGVTDDDLRRAMVPSGTSLLGLVKHLAYVERWWFRCVFAGEEVEFPWTDDDPDADWRIEPDETTADVIALYEGEASRAREIVADHDLDDHARLDVKLRRAHASDHTLRWIVTHMIEETARHNGHADILRELIDGSTGE